jgi:uncharacterized Zn-binding protein involved in type VI secretion
VARKTIRLGDESNHGGTMVSASAHFIVNGKLVCVDQDMHQCPIKDHGTTPVSATGSFTSSGRHVVLSGDVAGCGAVLVGGSTNTTSD